MASAPGGVSTRAQLAELLEDAEAKYAEAQTAYADADAQKSDQAKYDEAIAMAETGRYGYTTDEKLYHGQKEIEISRQFGWLCCPGRQVLYSWAWS